MLKSPIKIAYLSSENPDDKRVWSGTHYSIFKSLNTLGKVTVLGPYQPKVALTIGKIINQLALLLLKKRFDYRHSFLVSKAYGRHFSRTLKHLDIDLIVAPAASAEIAFLRTGIPVYYITDGTFDGCLNYHKALTNLLKFNIKQGHRIEKMAIEKSKYVIVSSEWAAGSVKNDYGSPEEKIRVIPFGANFERTPLSGELSLAAPTEWKLLFVGVYWESKGGQIAFNAFKLLYDKGYPVTLTVLGTIPPAEVTHPKLKVIPFIDKNSTEGQKILSEIYKAHHFLLLPTRFDCTPIVINEASAFGIPSLVAKSGGVAGHLKESENGYLIAYEDTGKAYAEKIEMLIKSPEKYLELRKESRNLYEHFLNWGHWTNEMKKIITS